MGEVLLFSSREWATRFQRHTSTVCWDKKKTDTLAEMSELYILFALGNAADLLAALDLIGKYK